MFAQPMPSGAQCTSDGVFMPAGQPNPSTTPGLNASQLVEAATRTAMEVAIPAVRDQIIPRILADRQALATAASGVGRGMVQEAGAVGRFAMFGIGALGTGVLLWGISRLVAAGNR
jgi:hypothetical protein